MNILSGLLQRTRKVLALLPTAALLCTLPSVAVGQGHMRDEVDFYIETYGEVRPEQDAGVARAHRVFERVLAVADKSSKRLPKLVVVNSRADPWAIALPAGYIVLSKQAVAICHEGVRAEEAEARLAMVLGHELAHLAHDDFLHNAVHNFLASGSGKDCRGAFFQSQQGAEARELAADDKGFIYAAIAGYPVDRLLETGVGKPHFFEYWVQQSNSRASGENATVVVRAARLRKRLGELHEKVDLFDFGVRLSHFDYCDDGLYFLREFQKVFPGREVLNNIGYCYLRLARQEMYGGRADFYWMPLLLDGETQARSLRARGIQPEKVPEGHKTLKQSAGTTSSRFMREAIVHLKLATEADPGYLPARLNLAVAYLYLGKPYEARAVLSEARDADADNIDRQVLEALALYEQSEPGVDLWPQAVAKLEKLAARGEAPPMLAFNLARLFELRARPTEARGHWNRLAEKSAELPAPLRPIVCEHQDVAPVASCLGSSAKSHSAPPWKWPVPVRGFERLSTELEERYLRDWRATPFDWYEERLRGHIYREPAGRALVLELDQSIQMQVLRGQGLGEKRVLASYCAEPLRHRALAQGEVWSCDDWAALTSGEAVEEVWWVAR